MNLLKLKHDRILCDYLKLSTTQTLVLRIIDPLVTKYFESIYVTQHYLMLCSSCVMYIRLTLKASFMSASWFERLDLQSEWRVCDLSNYCMSPIHRRGTSRCGIQNRSPLLDRPLSRIQNEWKLRTNISTALLFCPEQWKNFPNNRIRKRTKSLNNWLSSSRASGSRILPQASFVTAALASRNSPIRRH